MPKAAREPSIRPLFLMSLPRTGSTLVQRVLAAHPGVATASEPWLLLPLLYARREDGIRAEYCHMVAANAIADFAEAREGGTAAFDQRLREFVQGVYQTHPIGITVNAEPIGHGQGWRVDYGVHDGGRLREQIAL